MSCLTELWTFPPATQPGCSPQTYAQTYAQKLKTVDHVSKKIPDGAECSGEGVAGSEVREFLDGMLQRVQCLMQG